MMCIIIVCILIIAYIIDIIAKAMKWVFEFAFILFTLLMILAVVIDLYVAW